MDLTRQRVLITGGTRGIGWALARALHAAGAKIAVSGRDPDRLEVLRAERPELRYHACDLADPSQLVGFVARLHHDFGQPTMLVNNAGVQFNDLWRETDTQTVVDRIELETRVNLTSAMQLTSLLLPDLLEAEEAAVVNVTSILAYAPKRSAPAYSATKAGLRSFSRALRYQLAGTRVRVIEVVPPLVDTEMTAGRGKGKMAPEALAAVVVRALTEGKKDEILVGKAKLFRFVQRILPPLATKIARDS